MSVMLDESYRYPLPKMHRIRQHFSRPRLDDLEAQIRREFEKARIADKIKPGAKVAVAVGSRGIKDLARIVKEVLVQIQRRGGNPFIVSAMGSHGGGTQEGQLQILNSYGITENAMDVPVITAPDATRVGKTKSGLEVWVDSAALEADLIVPINRVKLHTDFVGDIQSGLCKMLTIGLGNHIGCSALHEASFEGFAETLIEAARIVMARAPVGFGVAILENAYDETAMIEAVPAEDIVEREKELLQTAKELMPTLMIPDIDVLVVEEIGKDISGAGFDPNVLGRSSLLKKFVLPVPQIKRMVLLDVTAPSHGNAIGVGLFDVITRRVLEKLDLPSMYANALAVKAPEDVKIPITAESEEEAIRFALQLARGVDRANLKIVKIKNTLNLGTIEVSEALLPCVEGNEKLERLS